jgi:hypothetical protein
MLYTVLDLMSMESGQNGKTEAELSTLRSEDGDHLPVFTSLALFSAFVDEYFDGNDSIEPAPFPIDPFELAQMVDPLAKNGEVDYLIFNPTAVSPGVWGTERDPIPVAHYCRFMSEIRPGLRRAVRQFEARFGPATPGSAAEKEAMGWLMPRIERLAESVGTRVDEWWESRDARE